MEHKQIESGGGIVPVTILTGFLGSGKTTLLNYILTQNHGKRIAVIENEFGEEIGVESLIAKNGADGKTFADFYELSNGCICCSVRDDLVSTLEGLLTRRDQFDYVIVETTGKKEQNARMADPGKLASIFWVDSELEGRIALDGIVTLVDAKNVAYHLENNTPEVLNQVAYADRILVNKSDLLPDENDRQTLESKLNQMNGLAPCIWTERSCIDLSNILDIKAFSAERAMDIHSHQMKEVPSHSGNVTTLCLTSVKALSVRAVELWLGSLLWEDSTMNIYRIKGVLDISNHEQKHILQGVQELFDITPSEPWEANATRVSKIVFIGVNLDSAILQHGLDGCAATA